MSGHTVTDLIKLTSGIALTAGTTELSRRFQVSGEDAKAILVNVTFSALMEKTGGAGSSVALQDSHDGGTTWATVQTANVATVANLDTLTFVAVGSLTASEYIAIYDYVGDIWACMLDSTGSDANPTGALWVAAGATRRTKTASLAGLNAIQVAAAVEAAFDALTGVTGFIATDDTAADGTMKFTVVQGGVATTKSVSNLADDSVAGAVTIAETTSGSYTASYELENNVFAGTDTAIWPLGRIVAVIDTNDTATCSAVYVTRRH